MADLCWSCRTAPANVASARRVVLARDYRFAHYGVGWARSESQRVVSVPRCASCQRHEKTRWLHGMLPRNGIFLRAMRYPDVTHLLDTGWGPAKVKARPSATQLPNARVWARRGIGRAKYQR